ncbi:NAD-dependent succinate-semialdehyde dehydrogenase [Pseudonocardia sulfidoxydans NBRC 16205]|uniref:NAD-dependent succinate-semialdehyde dehydrogenase n=1 Tax=Pseudonocardia sulfidoxydans NBRC 16205 TaxID=1223511 RepID=A0A511DCX5_9PSEU|nr:NAD-dependent succinate-semialdehyde dehydrogenase [Pseudonocardia sulfidoxydans]GEL22407.1 NAD-dependent succinate-semialdehyde dehydrogenase [Pseudonocardia sulfidoxydans NBRC 16205]
MTALAPAPAAGARRFTGSFVAGQWREPKPGTGQDVLDPADGSVIATVADSTVAECLESVDAAADALASWAERPPRQRGEILRRAFDLMNAERDAIAHLITRENGKLLVDSYGEVAYAAEFFRWFSEEAVRIGGEYRLAPNGDKQIMVTRKPIGVALLITPWNFPAAMATRKLAPALAAGCSVVLKPALETPLTATYIVDLLTRAGVPAGVVNLVLPSQPGPAVSAMLHHPALRKLSFTGSTEVGRLLLREAADNVVSAALELGGNAPVIVLEDADIDAAVDGVLVAKMRNGGAACTAANRIYVHRAVADDFAGRLTQRMAALRLGHGADPASGVAALVSDAEVEKICRLVDTTVAAGACATTGGRRPSGPGAFYPATVLVGVEHGMEITRQEIFGPVAPLIVFDEEEQAIRWANDTDRGLIGYVFSRDTARAVRIGHLLDTGMVAINTGVASDPAAPFGGVKQSGLGREGSDVGIEEFLEQQYLAVPV